jgi:5'-deoxynucleotidase YfbR-like HD superfamily hydrolase
MEKDPAAYLFLNPNPDGSPSVSGRMWLKSLSSLYRYEDIEMIHRVDLFTHQRRVTFLAMYLTTLINNIDEPIIEVDQFKIPRMGYHHDDPEMITGDWAAPLKAAMSSSERADLDTQEDQAAYAIARLILDLSPEQADIYIADQREIRKKETIESQIIDVADKWEALSEKTHEIRCGNNNFAPLVDNSRETFKKFEKYPFWSLIYSDSLLGFDKIPTGQEMAALPKLSLEDMKTPQDAIDAVTGDGFSLTSWPAYYRSWAAITWINFYNSLEKAIFQGWYMKLWKNWGVLPSDNTNSGLAIPGGRNVRKERDQAINDQELGTILPSGLWIPNN